MNGSKLSDALSLEKNRFMKAASDAAQETNNIIKALGHELAAKGLFHSGARYKQEMEIRFAKMDDVIDGAIALRKSFGRKVHELWTAESLNQLKDELHRYVDSTVQGFPNSKSG